MKSSDIRVVLPCGVRPEGFECRVPQGAPDPRQSAMFMHSTWCDCTFARHERAALEYAEAERAELREQKGRGTVPAWVMPLAYLLGLLMGMAGSR